MPPDTEPTRDELIAMAYVDGELDPHQRAELETRLPAEPLLARHVTHYRSLELLARQMAPPEPTDHEWARLERDPLQSSGSRLGWFLFVAGSVGLLAGGLYAVATSGELEALPKTCLLALIGGLGLLLGLAVRRRLALLPYDPYRRVKR